MQATIQQAALKTALGQASKALPNKTALPILTHYRLTAEDGMLQIAATDLHIGVLATTAAEIKQDGVITVEAATFTAFVSDLPASEPVVLGYAMRTHGGMLTVTSGAINARFNCLSVEDYPVLPSPADDAALVSIGGLQLADAVKQVAIAAATDDSRPVLAGVFFWASGTMLTLVAADGFRLATKTVVLDEPVAAEIKAIIPAKSLRELAAMAGQQSSPVGIALSPSHAQAMASLHQSEWISSLIEGSFVDHRQIIPRDFARTLTVDRHGLIGAIRRARIFAKDHPTPDKINFQIVTDGVFDAQLSVTGSGAALGDAETLLAIELDGDPGLQISVDARYALECLQAMDGERVWIGTNGPAHPLVFRPATDAALTHVVMPLIVKVS